MNWMRYEDSTRRPSRRDRERWIREKLQEAIRSKREEIRSGARPMLSPRVFDPQKSYFLKRFINLDKTTAGGVTWKLFGEPRRTQSLGEACASVSASFSARSERTVNASGASQTTITKEFKHQTLRTNVQYIRETESSATESQYSAAAREIEMHKRKTISTERADEDSGSISGSSGIGSQSTVDASTTTSPSPKRLRRIQQELRPQEHTENNTRKCFTAEEISSMLPPYSPNLPRFSQKPAATERLAAMNRVRSRDQLGRARRKQSAQDARREAKVHPEESARSVTDSTVSDTPVRGNRSHGGSNLSSGREGKTVRFADMVSETHESASAYESEIPIGDEYSESSDRSCGESTPERRGTNKCGSRPASERTPSSDPRSLSPAGTLRSRDLARKVIVPKTSIPRVNGTQMPETTPFSCGPGISFQIQVNVMNRTEAHQEVPSTSNLTRGEQEIRSVRVSRCSFASKTLISDHENALNGGKPDVQASAVATSVAWESRLEVRNQTHSTREIRASSTVISAAASYQEIRNYSSAKAPTPNREKKQPSERRSASMAASTLSVSRLETSGRMESREEVTPTACHTPKRTRKFANSRNSSPHGSINTTSAASDRFTLRSSDEDLACTPRSLATTVLFEPALKAVVDEAQHARSTPSFTPLSRQPLPQPSTDSESSQRSIASTRRSFRSGISNHKPVAKILPSFSFSPSLYRTPKEQSIIFDDCSESSQQDVSPQPIFSTQTFVSSLCED